MNLITGSALFLLIVMSSNLHSAENPPDTKNSSPDLDKIFLKAAFTHTTSSGSDSLNYRYYISETTGPRELLPLFIFFHGSGERGNDNAKQLKFLDVLFSDSSMLQKYPAYFLIPQCPEGKRWAEVDWDKDFNSMPEQPS